MSEPTKKTADYFRSLPYTRRVRLEEEADGDAYFVAFIEELEGVEADGANPTEALANLTDAFEDYLSAMLEWGEPVPEPLSWPESLGWKDIEVVSAPADMAAASPVPEANEERLSPDWITGVPESNALETVAA